MAFAAIRYDVEDGVATVTLNRPDRLNAVNGAMLAELVAAFDQADGDDAVRAVRHAGRLAPLARPRRGDGNPTRGRSSGGDVARSPVEALAKSLEGKDTTHGTARAVTTIWRRRRARANHGHSPAGRAATGQPVEVYLPATTSVGARRRPLIPIDLIGAPRHRHHR